MQRLRRYFHGLLQKSIRLSSGELNDMLFETKGNKNSPAILFFHAMGVTGQSSERVAERLQAEYFCIMPTSTVYCEGQKYISKADEIRQIEDFLKANDVGEIALVVASSIGADLAIAFLSQTGIRVKNAFFDGGQFAQIGKFTRRIMTPFLYFAIRSIYKKNGENLGKVMWCDDKEIRPYFVAAGKALKYGNMRRQLSDSLENKPLPPINEQLLRHTYFEFGSAEEHYKYRANVTQSYPLAHYPVFDGFNHMQYQIRDPQGFAEMLTNIIEKNALPALPFLKNE